MDDRTIVFSFDRKLGARLFEVYEHQDESRSFAPRRRAPAPSAKGVSLRIQRRQLAELCDEAVVDFETYRQLIDGKSPV